MEGAKFQSREELERVIAELREGVKPELHEQFDKMVKEGWGRGTEPLIEIAKAVKNIGPQRINAFNLRAMTEIHLSG